jgi:IclR family transcriptional regulator, acetate operon repressor
VVGRERRAVVDEQPAAGVPRLRPVPIVEATSVVDKVFRIVGALESAGYSLSLAELSRATELPKPTVYRIVSQLVEADIVERVSGRYRLGVRLFELGNAVVRERQLREAAMPFMEDLYEATHETVHLGIPQGLEILYVEKVTGHHAVPVPTSVGSRKPMYCTGLGKAVLAFSDVALVDAVVKSTGLRPYTPRTIVTRTRLDEDLRTVRASGVAFDIEESKLGLTCVAAPLRGRDGTAFASLSLTGPVKRFVPERFSAAVRAAALGVARAVGR